MWMSVTLDTDQEVLLTVSRSGCEGWEKGEEEEGESKQYDDQKECE